MFGLFGLLRTLVLVTIAMGVGYWAGLQAGCGS